MRKYQKLREIGRLLRIQSNYMYIIFYYILLILKYSDSIIGNLIKDCQRYTQRANITLKKIRNFPIYRMHLWRVIDLPKSRDNHGAAKRNSPFNKQKRPTSIISQEIFFYVIKFKFENNIVAIIFIMFCLHSNLQDDIQQKTDRTSSSTCTSESPEVVFSPTTSTLASILPNNPRLQLFEGQPESIQISQRLNQRAVSWMITLCWSKNFGQQCLWSTLLLYYSYKCKRNMKKQELELIMLSCLSLSLKLTEHKSYSTKEIVAMGNKDYCYRDIVQKQAAILELVNFNAIIPHNLSELYFESSLSAQKRSEILLVCELFMVKDHSIFFHKLKLDGITALIAGCQGEEKASDSALTEEIRSLMRLKQCKIILNKHSSKFNTDQIKARFI